MKEFLGVKIDASKLTTEELQELTDEAREFFFYLQGQLMLRKLAEHKAEHAFGTPVSSDAKN